MNERRIIPRRDLRAFHFISPPPAAPGRPTCAHTIKLDGIEYSCGREVYGPRGDRTHGGIHDAFRKHGDGGSVRW